MKEFKGTPPPWTAVKGIFWTVENEDSYRIASCVESENVGLPERDDSQANALLIAAAPDLLKACQAAIDYDRAIARCGDDPETMASFCTAQGEDLDDLYSTWITTSREALFKALGVEK